MENNKVVDFIETNSREIRVFKHKSTKEIKPFNLKVKCKKYGTVYINENCIACPLYNKLQREKQIFDCDFAEEVNKA